MATTLDAPALIEAIAGRLTDAYIFPDRAETAVALLRANLAAGRYDAPVGDALCRRVNEDLLVACADQHLRLIWHEASEAGVAPQSDEELIAELRKKFRLENHGVRRVERLAGNIGVIELTVIPDAAAAGDAIAAAFELVQHTYGLIFDLRGCRGGAPDGEAYLCSFLFADSEVHLSDVIEGPHGPTHQFWTSGYLPAPRYLDRPVSVLVSAMTFSGGEAFAYDLQAQQRATVVGDVTRGGAHPSTVLSLGEHVELRLPVARTVNPITGGNWEGVGVQPDTVVPAIGALDTAYGVMLDALLGKPDLPASAREEAGIARRALMP